MKITILTQYYPPETGAPQNRLSDLALRLNKNGHEVTILTAMPNYPKNEIFDSYKGRVALSEKVNGIKVLRSWIFVASSRSVVARLLNYFSFVFTSLWYGLFKLPKQDFLMCESPPLFLGISAWILTKAKRAKLIFNVSDLWPESAEKLGIVTNKTVLNLAEKLELWLYKKSFLITGQTQGIVENIRSRTFKKNIHWLPNGVSPEIFDLNFEPGRWRHSFGLEANDFILSYVGVIGHAQGLDVILKAAAQLKHKPNIKFVIAGDGPELFQLKQLAITQNLSAVLFTGAVDKNNALEIVFNSNAAIVPLRKIELFKGAIPSKIFENLVLSKPLLLGVDGEAKDLFITQAKAGIYFEPENEQQLANAILELELNRELCKSAGENGRQYVIKNFSRDAIATGFLDVLLKANNNGRSL